MIEVSQCVICDGAIEKLKRALVAPFMARRIWNRAPICVDLVRCKSCTFIFYNPRLDDGDLRKLFKNYRDHEYQRARHASEPWYTQRFNFDLASPDSYEIRRASLRPFFTSNMADTRSIAFSTMVGTAAIWWSVCSKGPKHLFTTFQAYHLRQA